MKKKAVIFLALLANVLNAQDQLFKKDNSKLQVKILEINPDEVKYKAFDNLNGPTYTENKNNVSLIIYQDGKHETFSGTSSAAAPQNETPSDYVRAPYDPFAMNRADSLMYYSYSNNISINFLSFFNNEIALMYQAEFFKSHFNIQIPLCFGVEKPNVTQSVYFNNFNNQGSQYSLNRKIFEAGFGINYYPMLNSEINYYIGPMLRYAQYSGTQTYSSSYFPYPATQSKNSTLSRYAMGITNGVIIRTRSRLTVSTYATIGFKNDVVNDKDKLKDPLSNTIIEPVERPVAFYFTCGFNVGFNF